jgi:hypothetical protein
MSILMVFFVLSHLREEGGGKYSLSYLSYPECCTSLYLKSCFLVSF